MLRIRSRAQSPAGSVPQLLPKWVRDPHTFVFSLTMSVAVRHHVPAAWKPHVCPLVWGTPPLMSLYSLVCSEITRIAELFCVAGAPPEYSTGEGEY